MIVEKETTVVTPVDNGSTSVGMMILFALIALAVGITAFYFATASQNNPSQYVEHTTETHDVTPITVPQPVSVPQPVAVPVPQPAAPAPAQPAQSAPSASSSESSSDSSNQ